MKITKLQNNSTFKGKNLSRKKLAQQIKKSILNEEKFIMNEYLENMNEFKEFIYSLNNVLKYFIVGASKARKSKNTMALKNSHVIFKKSSNFFENIGNTKENPEFINYWDRLCHSDKKREKNLGHDIREAYTIIKKWLSNFENIGYDWDNIKK